jgi:hypothetical protein
MVSNSVESFGAEIEWGQNDIGAPNGMVEAVGEIRGEGILAGMTAGPVAAIVPESDCLGERLVEMQLSGDGYGDLCDLEGMGQSGSSVIVREDEDLGLSGETAKRSRPVEDAISVALETCPNWIGWLGDGPVAAFDGSRGARSEKYGLKRFSFRSHERLGCPNGRPGVSVGVTSRCGGV